MVVEAQTETVRIVNVKDCFNQSFNISSMAIEHTLMFLMIAGLLNFCDFIYFAETIAFHAVLQDLATIPLGTAVIFPDVLVNSGDG